jgi:hypothetical protein
MMILKNINNSDSHGFCCDSVFFAKVILRKFKNKLTEFTPSGDADKVNLKYTDSGLIKVILISPKMLDFAVLSFTEFPKV